MNCNKNILNDFRKTMYQTLILFLLSQLVMDFSMLFSASYMGAFFDGVFNENFKVSIHSLVIVICFQILSIFIAPAIDLLANIFMLRNALYHDRIVYRQFLNKQYEDVMNLEEGSLQSRIEEDVNEFRYYWVVLNMNKILAPILFIGVIIMIAKINMLYGVLAMILYSIKIMISLLTRKRISKYEEKTLEYKEDYKNTLITITKNPVFINLYGISENMLNSLDNKFTVYLKLYLNKFIKLSAFSNHSKSYLEKISQIIILMIGCIMTSKNYITIGNVISMLILFTVFGILYKSLDDIVVQSKYFKVLLKRMNFFYDDFTVHKQVEKAFLNQEADSLDRDILMKVTDLSYSYDDTYIINNISLEIKSKEKIGIYGSNGSGKSTLIKILSGNYNNYQGKIEINFDLIKNSNHFNIRDFVAYIPQDTYLFEGTVYENVILDKININKEKIISIMKELDIYNLKDRHITASSNCLSGGEKQRISIARAILKNSPLILMDEPTNNLDKEGKEWLIQFIYNSEKSILIVTHDNDIKLCLHKSLDLNKSL